MNAIKKLLQNFKMSGFWRVFLNSFFYLHDTYPVEALVCNLGLLILMKRLTNWLHTKLWKEILIMITYQYIWCLIMVKIFDIITQDGINPLYLHEHSYRMCFTNVYWWSISWNCICWRIYIQLVGICSNYFVYFSLLIKLN